jgi:hypothetical protein
MSQILTQCCTFFSHPALTSAVTHTFPLRLNALFAPAASSKLSSFTSRSGLQRCQATGAHRSHLSCERNVLNDMKIVTLSTYTTKRETREPCACRRIVHWESVTFCSVISRPQIQSRVFLSNCYFLPALIAGLSQFMQYNPKMVFLSGFTHMHPPKLKPPQVLNANSYVCTSVALQSTACAVRPV